MAQWSRSDRTLYAKLVYYGPAYGGKTSNLQTLHRLTDPQGKNKLLSVKTANDRTLFFDLLPLDLGDILGHQVAMKLYTVPGQVRYDTTRQVVLAGSDAIVFVADSTKTRREQNVWSQQNLQMNMRAKRLDPKRVPVLYQFNKQDLAEAAPPDEVASWLKIDAAAGFPGVAVRGDGVLETFRAASRAMLERLLATAGDSARKMIDLDELGRQIDQAFAPIEARLAEQEDPPVAAATAPHSSIVLQGDDLLERSVRSSVQLGERLADESARAGRLEQEADAFRSLSDSLRQVGSSFDRQRIAAAALETSARILEAPVVSLLARTDDGAVNVEQVHGGATDPLAASDVGRELAGRMAALCSACVVDDLATELGRARPAGLAAYRAVVTAPVDPSSGRCLLAYAAAPDGRFDDRDVRFLSTVAGHLAAGLEKARLHGELASHRDDLERAVARRTAELREAYDELRELDRMKDRFLSSLSHEMKTPLTAVLTSGIMLRDYGGSPEERGGLVQTIVDGAQAIQRRLDDVFRIVSLEQGQRAPDLSPLPPGALVDEVRQIAPCDRLDVRLEPFTVEPSADRARLARAVANLIDNASKFSAAGEPVELHVRPGTTSAELPDDAWVISVLDRGPGIPVEDRVRVFLPFEQGGDPLTGKPSGVGLGLHEARTIVERHGGQLLYLARPDGGSEFRIVLPLEAERAGRLVEVSRV